MTAISMTMKEYFLRKGDEKAHRILMFIPYNFREKPADKSDFSFNNKIAVLPVILDLVNDFPTGVKHISEQLRPIRQSFMTLAFYYLIKLLNNFPYHVSYNAIDIFA